MASPTVPSISSRICAVACVPGLLEVSATTCAMTITPMSFRLSFQPLVRNLAI